MSQRWLPALLLLSLTTLALAEPPLAASVPDYRDILRDTLDLHDQRLELRGEAPAAASVSLRQILTSGNQDAFWVRLMARVPPPTDLRPKLQRAKARLLPAANNQVKPRTHAKDIAFPEPAPMSRCVDASAATAHAMLEAWAASAEALAAAKWACLQTEAGENSAFICTALAIETEALQTELDQESFCLGDQRDATLAALQQTQSNVVDHLNQRADATVSSRASQVSMDSLQDTLDSLLVRLAELRAAVTANDHQLNAELADLLGDATALAAQLTALSADIHDARFRMQAVQVNVEDVQDRLADLQALTDRLTSDAAQLRARLNSAANSLTSAQSTLQTAASEHLDRQLALALGAADRVVLRFRLPAARGGELERSREVLIRALTGYEAQGSNTTAARAKLVAGDQFYNLGQALDAYDQYAQAYRLLTQPSAPPSATLMRNSFE